MFKDEGDFHASVFIMGPNNQTVLIRNQRDEHQYGRWKFPGGKKRRRANLFRKRRGEQPVETLLREVLEETGLRLRKHRLRHLCTLRGKGEDGNTFNKHFFTYHCYSFWKLRPLSDEYEEARTFGYEELEELPDFHPEYRRCFIRFVKPKLPELLAGRHH